MAGKNKLDIQWEDDDQGFGDLTDSQEFTDSNDQEDFGQLLAGESDESQEPLAEGDQVEALISYIPEGSDDIMLEISSKVTGVIARQDISDENGQLKFKTGDRISAYVVSLADGEVILSNSVSNSVAKKQALETAYESRMPVKGKVTGVKKGGFDITIMGRKAFCPVSQISLSFVENQEEFLGKELDFRIQKLSSRDCVVSRTALLQEQAGKTLEALKEHMANDTEAKGKVAELRDFGAMVDLGGILGMVHISELSYGHPTHPSEVLSVGDEVTVKVLKIDESGRQPRIALSMKALLKDPWDQAQDEFKPGQSYSGKVVRLTDFGAFVELKPGIDGLIHLSEMSWEKRVYHAKEVMAVGDRVSVRVTDCNPEKKRLSLSLKAPEDDPWFEAETKYSAGSIHECEIEQLRPFGAIATFGNGVSGMIPVAILREAFGDSFKKKACPPAKLTVKVLELNKDERKMLLSLQSLDDKGAEARAFEEYLDHRKQEAQKKPQPKAQGSFGDLLQQHLGKSKKI